METGKIPRTFKHLTRTDRLRIEKWRKSGLEPREIADRLRVHISTIYRELHRGEYEKLDGATWEMETAYSPDIAEEKYQKHLREKGRELKIGNDQKFADFIERLIIEENYSPAAALARAKEEGFETEVSIPNVVQLYSKRSFF